MSKDVIQEFKSLESEFEQYLLEIGNTLNHDTDETHRIQKNFKEDKDAYLKDLRNASFKFKQLLQNMIDTNDKIEGLVSLSKRTRALRSMADQLVDQYDLEIK